MSTKKKAAPGRGVTVGLSRGDSLPSLKVTESSAAAPAAPPLSPQAPAALPAIKTFEHYELLWQTAHDALSTTYAAKRRDMEGLLAVRIFNEKVRSEYQVRQLQAAANRASELTHANAVCVYETAVAQDGSPYVVSEFIEVDNLGDVLAASKRLDIGRFLHIFLQVCDSLKEAHTRQLFHGNLCPGKIVFPRSADGEIDVVKLADFGMPPDPVQNAFYLSPDQWLDQAKIDARSDIYSLGCLMYEALVGAPPFTGHQRSNAALNCLHELAGQFAPATPEHKALKLLDCIIIKCLQTDRCKRFRNIGELSAALGLVDSCIRDGSNKRLPAKAEKLLLFRFLDFFDKKILACAFIYMLVALASVKVVAELQLQKYIDGAQLALVTNDLSLAQANWNAALHQAQWANKPPSLQADLHWELGDVYYRQMMEARVRQAQGLQDELARDAIGQYEQSLNYFGHGDHFRACSITLLQNIGGLWTSLDDTELRDAREVDLRKQVKAAYSHRRDAECAKLGGEFLKSAYDDEIVQLTAKAYRRLAERSSGRKALRFYERSQYYFSMAGDQAANATPDEVTYGGKNVVHPLLVAQRRLHLEPSRETIAALAQEALVAGDIEAAAGEASLPLPLYCAALHDSMQVFFGLRETAYRAIPEKGPTLTKGINALKQALSLEEEANGKHSDKLTPTLLRLAQCYRGNGQLREATETYRRALLAFPPGDWAAREHVLIYADLLSAAGHKAQATTFLEKQLRTAGGDLDFSNPLLVRLIKCYADQGLTSSARNTVRVLSEDHEFQPEKLRVPVVLPGGDEFSVLEDADGNIKPVYR